MCVCVCVQGNCGEKLSGLPISIGDMVVHTHTDVQLFLCSNVMKQ